MKNEWHVNYFRKKKRSEEKPIGERKKNFWKMKQHKRRFRL